MNDAVELATKVVAIFGSILALVGYVLGLGAAILWLRLNSVDLPPDLPVSLASREELIVIGARAAAVWIALAGVLGGLTAWIVTGNPDKRRFGYRDALLALAVTLATVFTLDADTALWSDLLVALPTGIAIGALVVGALAIWPSGEAVAAALLPIGAALLLGLALTSLGDGNEVATAIGATFIFGVLVLFTPSMQRWRQRQQNNRTALSLMEPEPAPEAGGGAVKPRPLAVALQPAAETRPKTVVWIGRVAVVFLVLLALGVVSVASQVNGAGDLHKALVSLSNGGCVSGTFVTRGKDQLVIAQPNWTGDEGNARVVVIPSKEVLEVQVYSEGAANLVATKDCKNETEIIVHPAEKPAGQSDGTTGGKGPE